MPHHPCCGGVEEKAVAREDVAVKHVLLFVLDECTESGVYDAFWFAGCARGVEYVDGVAWWE